MSDDYAEMPPKEEWPKCPDCGAQPKDKSWFDDFGMEMYDAHSPYLADGMSIGLGCDECGCDFMVRACLELTLVVEKEE